MNTAKTFDSGLVWFRRDLRLHDNAALHHALRQCRVVHCVFVFDTDILSALPKVDRRVEFILGSVRSLDQALRDLAGHARSGLIVLHARARAALPELACTLGVGAVFANHDDEPVALVRDHAIRTQLHTQGIAWKSFKDHVIFERDELLTSSGQPYRVFTPYKNAWLKRVQPDDLRHRSCSTLGQQLCPRPEALCRPMVDLAQLGFEHSNFSALRIAPGEDGARTLLNDFLLRIARYRETRDFPGLKGPSYLSVHLRFGTISIRQLVRLAHTQAIEGSEGAQSWLNELIWRDFYHQILSHFPHVVGSAFKPEYDAIVWDSGAQAEARFLAWCTARTGYPLVDAAMTQLNHTGYMHNRLRMVAASFLVKDLGIDWRWGERYFAQALIDFDLAANNGGWQWVASTGCDAQPYFRVFNPVTQSEKFDPQGKFISRYLPQLAGLPAKLIHAPWNATSAQLTGAGIELGVNYPQPLVQHHHERVRTLLRYGAIRPEPSVELRNSRAPS